jgi:hypothetical protein
MDANADFQEFLASLNPEISEKLTNDGIDDFPTLKTLIVERVPEYKALIPRLGDQIKIEKALKALESAAGAIPNTFARNLYSVLFGFLRRLRGFIPLQWLYF